MEPHNDTLSRLLALAQLRLDPESLAALLEHEKWMLKEKHKHEKEMKQVEVRLGSVSTPSADSSNTDSQFNSDTSHGQCGPEHIGLIAKTKVGAGAALRVKELHGRGKLPEPLLALAITASWCGERLGRWPNAKDAKVALGLRDEFRKAVEKFGPVKAIKSVDLVSEELLIWDPRIVAEQIDAIRPEAEKIQSMTISSSPLFAEFHKTHPHIDPETFDSCYNQNNGQFITSAIYLLRRKFREVPPKELNHIEGWEQRWQQYLPRYLNQWQDDLKRMENRMRVAQRAWKDKVG
jgi:hypothetical protein